jgi:hypothetical protein
VQNRSKQQQRKEGHGPGKVCRSHVRILVYLVGRTLVVKRLATAPARTHRATNASTILDDLPIFQVPLFLRNIPLLGMLLGTPAFEEIHPLAFEILE